MKKEAIKKEKVEKPEKIGNYFTKAKTLEFIPSGCQLLDLVLGGGWALGRISNVVGDNSSGKTLLAIEATANFLRKYPKGKVWYHESEAAFDEGYAEMLGMPVDKVTFVREEVEDVNTVEGWFAFLKESVIPYCEKHKDQPALYIVDTQDALKSKGEMARDIEKGSFNQEKNNVLNRLYRELTDPIERSKVHLMVISQTREAIGVTFGRKWRVTGEGALKFYASQRIQLAEIEKLSREVRGSKRAYGIMVKANCFKNKVGLPFRTCEFPIHFGYGMADIEASLDWLKTITNGLDGLGISEGYSFKDIQELEKEPLVILAERDIKIQDANSKTRSELRTLICDHFDLRKGSRKRTPGGIDELVKTLQEEGNPELEQKIRDRVQTLWNEIETEFLPKRGKYAE